MSWEKAQALWDRRPRLSRGWKTARNFLCAALILAYFWGLAGYPLPTVELEFRRLERAHLMPKSEIVLSCPYGVTDLSGTVGMRMHLVDPCVVGAGSDWAAVGYQLRAQGAWDTLDIYPIAEGPSPIPLVRPKLATDQWGYTSPLLFCRIPEEAARGEMEFRHTHWDREYQRESPLWKLEEGLWLASIEGPESGYSSDWLWGGAYTLRLYRVDGTLLLEQSGLVPKAM